MSRNLNNLFLDRCKDVIGKQGTFGYVKIFRDNVDRIAVRKEAWRTESSDYSNTTNVLYLCKEYLITKYLCGKGVVPEIIHKKIGYMKVEQQTLPVITEMVTEFVGPTLDLCNALGFLLEPKTMLIQLLQACAHLHHLNVLHLDIKPNNVTFDLRTKSIKLIDLGLAEMTGFHDLESEAGITKWPKGPGFPWKQDFGQIAEGGMMNMIAHADMPYMQSNFMRPVLGKSRLKNRVNIPGYEEPMSMIAELMGLNNGLVVDEKSDIYSVGMIVLCHFQACNFRSLWDKEKPAKTVLLDLLDLIVSLRGSCTDIEFWKMKKSLSEMAEIGGTSHNILRSETDALIYAMQHALVGDGFSAGLRSDIAHVLGYDVTNVLLSMINPCPKFRPRACEALMTLITVDPEQTMPVRKAKRQCHVEKAKGKFLVGRVTENGLRTVSMSVDINSGHLLWSKGIENMRCRPRKEREEIIETLVRGMHAWRGFEVCKDPWKWFRQLDRSHILHDDLYI